MTTDVKVINLGLSKLAANSIRSIAPPSTTLERYMANNYTSWRSDELALHDWLFAMNVAELTQTGVVTDRNVARKYQYLLPNDCLAPTRNHVEGQPAVEWERRGRYLYSAYECLWIEYHQNVPEDQWDTLFEKVMSCRVAYESAEYVTQSNTKKQECVAEYKDALANAASSNAFVIRTKATTRDDQYEILRERW